MTLSKVPLPVGGAFGPHLVHGFLGQRVSATKLHPDQFIRFCRAHGCNRHTDHTAASVAVFCSTQLCYAYT